MTDSDSVLSDLRKRLHQMGNKLMTLEGQALADRMVADERHRQTESQSAEIKTNIASLTVLVTGQGSTLNEIANGQQRITQRLDSDEKTRITTASALVDAEKARRERFAEPWVTPNRVIGLVLGLAAIIGYAQHIN